MATDACESRAVIRGACDARACASLRTARWYADRKTPCMPARAIDTATIAFGLVSIPVKIYSTSEPSHEIHFISSTRAAASA